MADTAPTQPSLSAEDRARLETIAERSFGSDAAFLRHLASAPPEGDQHFSEPGEGPSPGEGRGDSHAGAAQPHPSEPESDSSVSTVESTSGTGAIGGVDPNQPVRPEPGRLLDSTPNANARPAEASSHEDTVRQLRAALGAEAKISAGRREEVNDLQARLEGAEEKRDIEKMVVGEGEEIIGCLKARLSQAEAVLDELAAEFERRAKHWPRIARVLGKQTKAEHAAARAYNNAARLLREKQAALKDDCTCDLTQEKGGPNPRNHEEGCPRAALKGGGG